MISFQVFAGLDSVKVVNGDFMFFQPDGRAMAPNGNIYWPGFLPDDFTQATSSDIGAFTHELEHVYQYSQGESVLYKGLWLRIVGPSDPYAYDLHTPFSNLNIEQRGQVFRYKYFPNQFDVNPKSIVNQNGRWWEW
jgi:hypothetical protein